VLGNGRRLAQGRRPRGAGGLLLALALALVLVLGLGLLVLVLNLGTKLGTLRQ
jgi:hypothetical protein